MRPASPGTYRPSLLERLGLQRWLSQPARMAVRQIERSPVRSLLSLLGIALAIAVMILGSFSKDAIDYIRDFQFSAVQRYDFSISFFEPAPLATLSAVGRLPGVLRAEPFRAVPVRLIHGHRSRRLAVMGLTAERELLQLRDTDERPVDVPAEGLLLSEKLAELLGVRRGDWLTVEVLEGQRPVRTVVVTETLRDFSGLSAYMDLNALNRFLREGHVVSGAFLRSDPVFDEALYTELKRTPRVGNVASQVAALRGFEDTMAESLQLMQFFNISFACIIAFGVVYNAARITLSERARELATLRVIGLTRGEVSAALIGEVMVITVLAVPVGLAIGHYLAMFAVRALETDTMRFPFVLTPPTYATAVATVLAAAVVSCLIVRRRIDRLDLVSVLKSRD